MLGNDLVEPVERHLVSSRGILGNVANCSDNLVEISWNHDFKHVIASQDGVG